MRHVVCDFELNYLIVYRRLSNFIYPPLKEKLAGAYGFFWKKVTMAKNSLKYLKF